MRATLEITKQPARPRAALLQEVMPVASAWFRGVTPVATLVWVYLTSLFAQSAGLGAVTAALAAVRGVTAACAGATSLGILPLAATAEIAEANLAGLTATQARTAVLRPAVAEVSCAAEVTATVFNFRRAVPLVEGSATPAVALAAEVPLAGAEAGGASVVAAGTAIAADLVVAVDGASAVAAETASTADLVVAVDGASAVTAQASVATDLTVVAVEGSSAVAAETTITADLGVVAVEGSSAVAVATIITTDLAAAVEGASTVAAVTAAEAWLLPDVTAFTTVTAVLEIEIHPDALLLSDGEPIVADDNIQLITADLA